MLETVLALTSHGFFGGYYGGSIGNFLLQLQQAGAFSYAIPFLLIFALIFGILTRMQLFKENKSINAIIALSVSLLALQFDFVPRFFSEIFPRLGVGLAVILVIFILLGLFLPSTDNNGINWMLFIAGAVVFIIVLNSTFRSLGYPVGGNFWYFVQVNFVPIIIAVGVIIALIVIVKAGETTGMPKLQNPYWGTPPSLNK